MAKTKKKSNKKILIIASAAVIVAAAAITSYFIFFRKDTPNSKNDPKKDSLSCKESTVSGPSILIYESDGSTTTSSKISENYIATINSFTDATGYITIDAINPDSVTVSFDTDIIVKRNESGGINLNSKVHNWTDEIKFNQPYHLATQTMDAGTSWTLLFCK